MSVRVPTGKPPAGWLTPAQAGVMASRSESWVWKELRAGRLTRHRQAGLTFIDRAELIRRLYDDPGVSRAV